MLKPILFNTEMVKAIMDGRKTVTRRLINPQPVCYGPNKAFVAHDGDFFLSAEKKHLRCRVCGHDPEYSREGSNIVHHWKPPYIPGDILYVRETWGVYCRNWWEADYFNYRADWQAQETPYGFTEPPKWRPSIHMPKEAARLFLRVKAVRVDRLQTMTEEDAEEEGCVGCPYEHTVYFTEGGLEMCVNVPGRCRAYPEHWYCNHSLPEIFGRDIWDKTIKPADLSTCGWEANPWVWVIEFERISKEEAGCV